MPLQHGTRQRRDGQLFRAVLLSKDETRQTPLGVGYSFDEIKDIIERNSRLEENKGRIVIERASLPEDLKWETLRRL